MGSKACLIRGNVCVFFFFFFCKFVDWFFLLISLINGGVENFDEVQDAGGVEETKRCEKRFFFFSPFIFYFLVVQRIHCFGCIFVFIIF